MKYMTSCMNTSSKPYEKTAFSACGACKACESDNIIITVDTAYTVSLLFLTRLLIDTIVLRVGEIALIITQGVSIIKIPDGINGSFA